MHNNDISTKNIRTSQAIKPAILSVELVYFVLNANREKLASAPIFKETEDLSRRRFAESVCRYFCPQPYWTRAGYTKGMDPYRWGGEAQRSIDHVKQISSVSIRLKTEYTNISLLLEIAPVITLGLNMKKVEPRVNSCCFLFSQREISLLLQRSNIMDQTSFLTEFLQNGIIYLA